MASPTINLNDSLPAAPANGVNVSWQAVPSIHDPTIENVSAAVVGPGGSTEFLRADGTWEVPPGAGGGTPAPSSGMWFAAAIGSQHFSSGSVIGNFGLILTGFGSGSAASVAPTATTVGGNKFTSSALAGNSCGWYDTGTPNVTVGVFRKLQIKASFDSVTNTRWWIGMSDDSPSTPSTFRSDTPAANMFAFRFSPTSAGDTHIQAYVGTDATHQTLVDTGMTPDTGIHLYEIDWDGTNFTFYIDGSLVATINTNKPATSVQPLGLVIADNAGTANAKTVSCYAFYYQSA